MADEMYDEVEINFIRVEFLLEKSQTFVLFCLSCILKFGNLNYKLKLGLFLRLLLLHLFSTENSFLSSAKKTTILSIFSSVHSFRRY